MVNLENLMESTVMRIVAFIAVLAILGATIVTVFSNLGTVTTAFSDNASLLGHPALTAIAPALGLVAGIGLLLGLVRVIQSAKSR